jgi:hypothetical protein
VFYDNEAEYVSARLEPPLRRRYSRQQEAVKVDVDIQTWVKLEC